MNINIFILCFNESILLPHTIHHYKKYLPSCKITIYDNKSSDNSVDIARSLNCKIISWDSNNIIDDYKYRDIKNNCWKKIKDGWIIMIDMDEWLCITEKELLKEEKNGTTILNIKGVNIIGESKKKDLSDVDLNLINKCVDYKKESKKLCFLRPYIKEINYGYGAHKCNPIGKIKHSTNIYINKHMSNLGLIFLTEKMINRYNRSKKMRENNLATHYTNNVLEIINNYYTLLNNSYLLDKILII